MLRLGLGSFALAIALAAPTAHAQIFRTDELSAVTYRPSPGTHRYLMMVGAEIGGTTTPPVDLSFDYAYRPLYVKTFCEDPVVMINCEINQDRVAIVEHLVALHLGSAFAVGDRLEIALSVPLLYASGEGFTFRDETGNPGALTGGSGAGIGDPRLSVQTRLWGTAEEGFLLSAVVWGTVPLGQATMDGRYVGDDTVNVGAHAIAEVHRDDIRGAIMLGGFYRPEAELIGVDIGPMMSFGGAGEWHFTKIASLVGEIVGATGFGGTRNLIEGRGAGRLRAGPLELTLGAGVGLVRGPGVPWFRLLGGVRWAPLPDEDRDGDGVPAGADACPNIQEDEDRFADGDGCPELDNDGDAVPDGEDRCPNEREDIDEHEDDDGCPDTDDDADGVIDGYDSCLDAPEDRDGDRDDDGCPDLDGDSDGVEDTADGCPDAPEDTDGLADTDGCAETDADNDGVLDEDDQCPEIPGTECPPPGQAPPPGTTQTPAGQTPATRPPGTRTPAGQAPGTQRPGTTRTPAGQAPDAGPPPPAGGGAIDWTPP